MGYSRYDVDARNARAIKNGTAQKSLHENFTQRGLHKDMNPRNIKPRECRDSENHPFSLPIQIYLDVTGSMGSVPQELIVNGLPKMLSNLLNKGIKSPSILFGAVGDHECDMAPLQVGQFESGDEELDMWLSRTYIESNGGGNGGESYGLAWYFAANHVVSDAWEKRNQKGYVFTIGDEPNLPRYPADRGYVRNGLRDIMGNSYVGSGSGWSDAELIAAAKEKNHVYHIFMTHDGRTDTSWSNEWKRKIGAESVLIVGNHTEIPELIFRTILSNEGRLQKLEGDAQLAKLQKEDKKSSIVTDDLTDLRNILL